ncbi:MAG: ABC transporter ATP-binding protein [Ilumatobacteraceae bacterium]
MGGEPIKSASIDIDGLSVRYGNESPVVIDVSLHVAAGSITALLGPSGCGKTTLLRSIAGLERPESGTIRLAGCEVSGPRVWVAPQQRNIGMVFQDPALFPHMTVAENIGFGLRHSSAPERTARVHEMLELIELEAYSGRLPRTLSGGQQQRVALARSLAPSPGVLLLDEPFSALDAKLRTQLRTDVADIIRQIGVTAVFVTHDQDEAFVVGDSVGIMHQGALRQIGTPDEVYAQPCDPWVATFVGEANLLAGNAASGSVTTALGRLTLRNSTLRGDVVTLVRPETLVVGGGGVPAAVGRIDYFGQDTRVTLHLENNLTLIVRVRSADGLRRGTPTTVRYGGGPAIAWATDPLDVVVQ